MRIGSVGQALVLAAFSSAVAVPAQTADDAAETRAWLDSGRQAVRAARADKPIRRKARNVILFVGDGMGVSTVTAARILAGQRKGGNGEDHSLSFEQFPHVALAKTYNTNQQVADSAGTMTALCTGVKTKAGVIGLGPGAIRSDHTSVEGNSLQSLFEIAELRGLRTGIVTTTRVTHATPAACYAESPERDWEDDDDLYRFSPAAAKAGFADIARQLLEFKAGNGIDLVFGGGRRAFLPAPVASNALVEKKITPTEARRRRDGRDLIAEWRNSGGAYVATREEMLALTDLAAKRVLGLFSDSHMAFEAERSITPHEPSLTEMTRKAIALLAAGEQGYVLLVEGGRIDHGHHFGSARRALEDTVEFSRAVEAAVELTDEHETLIVVTADHSHTLTLSGYPTRGNPILGRVRENGLRSGKPQAGNAKDAAGLPYTTLSYANGPGYSGASASQPEGAKRYPHLPEDTKGIAAGRPDVSAGDTEALEFMQEATVPLSWETHSGEDVAVYARGPRAHLVHGTIEQHVVFHLIVAALGSA